VIECDINAIKFGILANWILAIIKEAVILQDMLVLLNGDLSPILGGGGGVVAEPAATTGQAAPAPQPEAGPFGTVWMIAIWGLVIVGMYFLMIRPQRKREKQAREMQANLKVGDNVLTNGGMFGRIADVGQDCFVVEFGTNRGIRIPIRKSDVLGIQTPKLTPTPPTETEKA